MSTNLYYFSHENLSQGLTCMQASEKCRKKLQNIVFDPCIKRPCE